MGRWLSAEHGALLTMREVTLRGVRAGRGIWKGWKVRSRLKYMKKALPWEIFITLSGLIPNTQGGSQLIPVLEGLG